MKAARQQSTEKFHPCAAISRIIEDISTLNVHVLYFGHIVFECLTLAVNNHEILNNFVLASLDETLR